MYNQLVGWLVVRAQSTAKDYYIGAEHELHSLSKSTLPLVITPQVFLSQTTAQIISTISERKTRKTVTQVLEPIYIPRALNTGTCIKQGDLFILLAYKGTGVSHS